MPQLLSTPQAASSTITSSFQSFFAAAFPIKKGEGNKVLLLILFKFIISFVYVLLSTIKKPLMILANDSGAEAIPVIKMIAVLPLSILLAVSYAWLSNKYQPTKIFFYLMLLFGAFFVTYIFYLYPNADLLSPHEHASALLERYPQHRHWIAVYRHWIHALNYSMVELFGQVSIFMIFWGITNELCTKTDAKRFYHLFIMGGCVGGYLATQVVIRSLSRYATEAQFPLVIEQLISYAIVGICLMILLYAWMYYTVFPKDKQLAQVSKEEEKHKMSFWQSIKYVARNPYLGAIAITVLACGMMINLVDVTYDANVKSLYPNKMDFLRFTARVTSLLLITSAITTLLVSGGIMRIFGWRKSAYIAPAMILFSSSLFFLTSKFRDQLGFVQTFLGVENLMFIVMVGVFQNVTNKLGKYAFFDSTKEIVYTSLDPHARRKGKAAVDMVGSRIGKSLSGFVHSFILWIAATSNVLNITSILFFFLILISIPWFLSIRYLDRHVINQ